MTPALGGTADLAKAVSIGLEKLPQEFRQQQLLFVAAREAFETLLHVLTGVRARRTHLVFQAGVPGNQ